MLPCAPATPDVRNNVANISIFNSMKTFAASKISTGFREILPFIQRGERINISYGRAKKPVAVLVPFAESEEKSSYEIGKEYFRKYGSSKGSLSKSHKKLLKRKLHEKFRSR
jgi:antitoxin (DNA-binding transcriptional repressor) of toxin-antitoxin stability system